MPRHFILVPFGSAGDVNPFLWIGHELQQRGHAATLIAPPTFADAARRAGVPHVPVGDPGQYERLVRNPKLWHPWHGMHLTLGFAGDMTAEYYDTIAAVRERAGPDVVLVGSLLALGARLAREKLRLPLATVHLQPSVILSLHDTPVMRAHLEWFARMPRWFKRLFFALPNPLDQCAGRSVRAACRTLGVPAPRSLMREWMNSPDGVLCLFPDWFGSPQPDWPPRHRLAGFPLYDLGQYQELSPAIERFLAAGPAPVVFTAGSAMLHAHEFFATALAVCRELRLRAVFATPDRAQLPAELPDTILATGYVPFSRLLPRAAAIVHHGGIGTLAQALAAGIPQLVMPMAHDQPDNAQRLVRLGVGRRLYPAKFTVTNVTAALRSLLNNPEVSAACEALAAKVQLGQPATITLDTLESLQRAS
ncbi:glycosyltransferase [Opitutus terrae]|uniref:Glycosyl transferase family 28 n=1 Tax=Opitutus terrae (strain DSM 11246 / JCM 15787 / PB90-1) TaxID=452637 RepID=B1ZXU8_OPITP|nr:glycosyltransferase [Opitutus terrae]ACB75150.1 glycosyl transferase family 28 [Opitutus terrae PB90-1]